MDRQRRAQHAARLLNDELFVETFSVLRENALRLWETTAPEDTDVREDAWRTIRVLSTLKEAFEKYARQGQIDDQMARNPPVEMEPR